MIYKKIRPSKICQKLGLILVINLVFILSFSSPVLSQECNWLPEEEGGEHFIEINNEVFFYTTLEDSREMQNEISDCRLMERELELRGDQAEMYESIIQNQSDMISDLESEIHFQRDLHEQGQEGGFWTDVFNSPRFNFTAGVFVGATTVGLGFYLMGK